MSHLDNIIQNVGPFSAEYKPTTGDAPPECQLVPQTNVPPLEFPPITPPEIEKKCYGPGGIGGGGVGGGGSGASGGGGQGGGTVPIPPVPPGGGGSSGGGNPGTGGSGGGGGAGTGGSGNGDGSGGSGSPFNIMPRGNFSDKDGIPTYDTDKVKITEGTYVLRTFDDITDIVPVNGLGREFTFGKNQKLYLEVIFDPNAEEIIGDKTTEWPQAFVGLASQWDSSVTNNPQNQPLPTTEQSPSVYPGLLKTLTPRRVQPLLDSSYLDTEIAKLVGISQSQKTQLKADITGQNEEMYDGFKLEEQNDSFSKNNDFRFNRHRHVKTYHLIAYSLDKPGGDFNLTKDKGLETEEVYGVVQCLKNNLIFTGLASSSGAASVACLLYSMPLVPQLPEIIWTDNGDTITLTLPTSTQPNEVHYGANIYYTLDGKLPTVSSESITLDNTSSRNVDVSELERPFTLRAVAHQAGWIPSPQLNEEIE